MATRMQIVHTDDLDGSEGASTVQFSFDGVSYEIDLSAANREALATALAPYVGSARKVGGRRAANKRRATSGGASATDIRAWALSQGIQVSSRGRVSSELREAYERAHS